MSIPRRAAHLLLLVLLSLSSAAAAALPAVYDTDGHELSADADYYVLPAPGSPGGGGGLTLAPNGFQCPLFVAQETDPLRKGLPLRFTPLPQQQQQGGHDRTVRVSSDVGVHFAALTTCVQTTEWHVSIGAAAPSPPAPRSGSRRRLVLTGPVLFPSPSGRDKVFRVEKLGRGRGYKLAWCGGGRSSSSGAGAPATACQDLGVVRDDGGRRAWLATAETQTDQAHAVVFQKAATIRA